MTNRVLHAEDPHPGYCCDEAHHLATWAERLLLPLTEREEPPTQRYIDHLKLELQDHFWTVRQICKREHRDRLADWQDNPCVYGVYLDNLRTLMEVAIFTLPKEFEASKPAPTPSYLLHGIPLGLFEEATKEAD